LPGTKAKLPKAKSTFVPLQVYKVMVNAHGFFTNDFLLLPKACSHCASANTELGIPMRLIASGHAAIFLFVIAICIDENAPCIVILL
jgi:hypothetical protein